MDDDETDQSDPARVDVVGEPGPRWLPPATDYPSQADQQSTWSEPVPGPAPAEPVTPTTLPPAYRVWAPSVATASDPGAA